MRVLAEANPNPKYIYFRNLKEITIQAVLSGDHIIFYELGPGRYYPLKEEVVQQLFPLECSVEDMPFVIPGNEDFYAILMRENPDYTSEFERIKAKNQPVMVRTKKKIISFTRTK